VRIAPLADDRRDAGRLEYLDSLRQHDRPGGRIEHAEAHDARPERLVEPKLGSGTVADIEAPPATGLPGPERTDDARRDLDLADPPLGRDAVRLVPDETPDPCGAAVT